MRIFSHAKIPALGYLVTVVGGAATLGCSYLVYKVCNDNTVNIIGRKENPHPWLLTKDEDNGEYLTFVEGYGNENENDNKNL